MSNYTEREILAVAIKILEEVGEMSTTELKEALNEEMNPDGNDLEINLNRNDTKFDQKVRNMISHRANNELLLYCDYRREGNNGILTSKALGKKQNIEEEQAEIERRKKQKRKFLARRVDFDEVNHRNRELGLMGEEFVLKIEKESLSTVLSEKVKHISVEEGDGAGYDILSYDKEGTPRFLEVKTTTGPLETPFYLSENERAFLEEYTKDAELVRVYEFDTTSKKGKIQRITGEAFLTEIQLQTVAYKATIKKEEE